MLLGAMLRAWPAVRGLFTQCLAATLSPKGSAHPIELEVPPQVLIQDLSCLQEGRQVPRLVQCCPDEGKRTGHSSGWRARGTRVPAQPGTRLMIAYPARWASKQNRQTKKRTDICTHANECAQTIAAATQF